VNDLPSHFLQKIFETGERYSCIRVAEISIMWWIHEVVGRGDDRLVHFPGPCLLVIQT